MQQLALAVPLGLVIGLVIGTLGAGGSLLTVPALVYLLDQPVAAATTASLAIVAANASVGATVNARRGRADTRLAASFAVAGVVGALAGSWLNRLAPGAAVLLGLSVLMIAAAVALWRGRPQEGVRISHAVPWYVGAATGLGVGVLTGFFGVGGGFVVLPVLVLLVGLPMRVAVGTSLIVIAITSTAGLAGHLGTGGISWGLTLVFGAAGIVGAWIGAHTCHRIPVARLSQGFAVLLVALATVLIVENAGVVGL
jgi:uncharacterized protein